jgi:putative membrane protein
MWWDGPWHAFHWMWIFPLIFLAVLVLFLFRGPRWPMCGGHRQPDHEESARESLDRRYARGEISREEYQRIRKDLE